MNIIQKVDILAMGVHPDDVELSASGTLLSHIAQGKTVGLLDLTRGELGTRGSAEIRDEEGLAAAKMMGATFRVDVGMADGHFQYNTENILKIVQVIRAARPEIVLLNAIEDRHPDHGRSAKLEANACYYSGLSKIKTLDNLGQPQERWRPKAVYHYIQDYNLKPDFVVDITPFIDKKMEVIACFKSQFHNTGGEDKSALSTPISSKDFMDFIKAKGRVLGRAASYEFAEGFTVNRTIGTKNLFNLD